VGENLEHARDRAYAGVDAIIIDGGQHRTDIALAAQLGAVTAP
jgi:phosphoribosylamine--glycine ligase